RVPRRRLHPWRRLRPAGGPAARGRERYGSKDGASQIPPVPGPFSASFGVCRYDSRINLMSLRLTSLLINCQGVGTATENHEFVSGADMVRDRDVYGLK